MRNTTSVFFLFTLCLVINHGIAISSQDANVNDIDTQKWLDGWNKMLEQNYDTINPDKKQAENADTTTTTTGGANPDFFYPYTLPIWQPHFFIPPWIWPPPFGFHPPPADGFKHPPGWGKGGAHPPLPSGGFKLPPWVRKDPPPFLRDVPIPPWHKELLDHLFHHGHPPPSGGDKKTPPSPPTKNPPPTTPKA